MKFQVVFSFSPYQSNVYKYSWYFRQVLVLIFANDISMGFIYFRFGDADEHEYLFLARRAVPKKEKDYLFRKSQFESYLGILASDRLHV